MENIYQEYGCKTYITVFEKNENATVFFLKKPSLVMFIFLYISWLIARKKYYVYTYMYKFQFSKKCRSDLLGRC